MIKKVVLALLLASFQLLSANSVEDKSGYVDAVTVSVGESKDHIKIYRVGVRKDFDAKWAQSSFGYLSGYYELSFNYWKGKKGPHKENYGVALSPVFNYYFDFGNVKPYLEGGIGVSFFRYNSIDHRNTSSKFLFEDRLGAGVRVGDFDFSFRYMHYSNAGIVKPNSGIDIFIGSISYKFWYNIPKRSLWWVNYQK